MSEKPFLTDIKTLRERARQHIEKGAIRGPRIIPSGRRPGSSARAGECVHALTRPLPPPAVPQPAAHRAHGRSRR